MALLNLNVDSIKSLYGEIPVDSCADSKILQVKEERGGRTCASRKVIGLEL